MFRLYVSVVSKEKYECILHEEKSLEELLYNIYIYLNSVVKILEFDSNCSENFKNVHFPLTFVCILKQC